MPKPLTLCVTTNCEKFQKRWEYHTNLPASSETCMQVKKQQLELDMEQTGLKLRKEYIKAVYCHPAYLSSMQSTSDETLDWMKHHMESSFLGENVHDTTLMAESKEVLRSLMMKVKEESEKSGLNLNIKKN